ncbi:MAG: prephenate dehydratase [Flavobacteriales bacterium]
MITKKIAIQGIKGSFHDEATHILFNETIELVECFTFKDVAKSVVSNKADYGVMAIENSIAGSILPNYNLLVEYNLEIVDELYMPINHYVMAKSGQKLNQIKEVHSHPMALMQCENYFEDYPKIQMVEVADTALAAKQIVEHDLENIAAIAPKRSAKVYGLNILGEKIQTIKNNFTRFFVVQKKENNISDFNKISIKFKVSHQSGSLAQILNQIAFRRINMSKIQSVPIIEEPWNYAFFADLLLDEASEFDTFLESVHPLVKDIKILGKYQNKRTS